MPEKKENETSQEKRSGWREAIVKEVFDEERQEVVRLSEISIIIKEYNDIFSDFDPRPYSQRALSDDFLQEAKKASLVKSAENLALMFLVPEAGRKPQSEAMIKKRLHEYFKHHHDIMNRELTGTQVKGVKLTLLGFGLLLVATFIKMDELKNPNAFQSWEVFLTTFLEPAGWFTMWTGLEHIFYTWRGKKEDHEFYERMAKAKINFTQY
ncbi:Uncharacterised protein [uncultured archaeon]|nr:Uncharacterised protein [uncultured archaeon]